MHIKLRKCDCFEFIKQMPDKCIDVIIADPPYGISYQSGMRSSDDRFGVLQNDTNDMRLQCYSELYRILKDDCFAAIFCSYKNFAIDYVELSKYFNIANVIVWYKGAGGIGNLKHLATDYELCIICSKGKASIRGKRIGSVWYIKKVAPAKMVHPTEKPVMLMKLLLEKFSDMGDVCFDPFMGSGTVGIACVKMGLDFIGCEIDDIYYNIAKERIKKVLEKGFTK